jgi:hypothetical protein
MVVSFFARGVPPHSLPPTSMRGKLGEILTPLLSLRFHLCIPLLELLPLPFPLLLLIHTSCLPLLPLFLGLFFLLSAAFLEFLLSLPFLLLKFLLSLSPLPLKFLLSLMPLSLKFLLFYLPLFVEGFLLLLLLPFVLVLLVSRFCLKSSRELLLRLLKLCFLIPILLLVLFFLFLPYLLSACNLDVIKLPMFLFLVTMSV